MSIQQTITTIHNLTKNLYERLMQIQENEKTILELSSKWKNKPMYLRDKNTKLIALDNRFNETKAARCAEIKDASTIIQKLLNENFLLFHNEPLVDQIGGMLVLIRFLSNI